MSGIDQKDLYPIIEIANQRLAADQDRLTDAQVDEIAAELGIPREYVDEAQTVLKEHREKEAAEAARKKQLRQQLTWVGAGVGALIIAMAISGYNGISATHAQVERQSAQVINVMERQVETQKRLAEQPHSPSKAAELAGSENRVRIERKRYDEHAAYYNAQAGSFPSSLWCMLFGLPDAVPLSNSGDAPW
jgi:hypothetical protein